MTWCSTGCRRKTVAFVAAIVSTAFAGIRGPNYDGMRSMGMGNTTVAVTTDRTAIFHNPAGLGLIKDKLEISLSPIMLSADNRLITLVKEIQANSDKIGNWSVDEDTEELIDVIEDLDGYWMGLHYLPQVTVAKKNLGFGMYSVWPFGIRVESGHLVPKLAIKGQRDLVFTWAVGVPLKRENHQFGISMEYVQRTPVDERITTYTETFLLMQDVQERPLGVIGDYGNIQHGASFDIGFMHNIKGFRIAWGVKDIFGVIGGELVFPPQLDIGCAYFFPQLDEVEWIRGLILAADISDVVGFEEKGGRYEQFAKKTHLGFEWDLKYIALRAGLNQGYPTAGVGLNLGIVSLEYAWFTEEEGYFVGQLPIERHILSLSVGLRLSDVRGKIVRDIEEEE